LKNYRLGSETHPTELSVTIRNSQLVVDVADYREEHGRIRRPDDQQKLALRDSVGELELLVKDELTRLREKGHPHDVAKWGDPWNIVRDYEILLEAYRGETQKLEIALLIGAFVCSECWDEPNGYLVVLSRARLTSLWRLHLETRHLFKKGSSLAYLTYWDASGDWVSNGEELAEALIREEDEGWGEDWQGSYVKLQHDPEKFAGEAAKYERTECDQLVIDKEGLYWKAYIKHTSVKAECHRLDWSTIQTWLKELAGDAEVPVAQRAPTRCVTKDCTGFSEHARGLDVCHACWVSCKLYRCDSRHLEVYFDEQQNEICRRPKVAPGGVRGSGKLGHSAAMNVKFCKNPTCSTLDHRWDNSAGGTWVGGRCPTCAQENESAGLDL